MPRFSRKNAALLFITLSLCFLFIDTRSIQVAQGQINKPYSAKPYRSKYYIVYTDMPAKEARGYAQHMDKLYLEIAKRFKGFKQNYKWQRLLFIFKDQKGYREFLSVNKIQVQNSGGLFFARGNELAVVTFVGDRSKSEVRGVLQHEGFHQFAAYFFVNRLPVSINEGMAEYFQDALPYNSRLHLGVADSRRLSIVKQDLKAGSLYSIQELLTITPNQWTRVLSSDVRAGMRLYNQSWALVYYLIKSDRRVFLQFAVYLNYLNDGKDAQTAFRQSFKNSTTTLNKKWHEFLEKLEPDPLMETIYKIEFLAQGLSWLNKNGEAMPKTMAELKKALQSRNFRVRRTLGNSIELFDSKNEKNFTYDTKKGEQMLLLKPSKARNALPTISAPGMRPRPELIWSMDKEVSYSEVVLK